jgi:hypothetical protein
MTGIARSLARIEGGRLLRLAALVAKGRPGFSRVTRTARAARLASAGHKPTVP